MVATAKLQVINHKRDQASSLSRLRRPQETSRRNLALQAQ